MLTLCNSPLRGSPPRDSPHVTKPSNRCLPCARTRRMTVALSMFDHLSPASHSSRATSSVPFGTSELTWSNGAIVTPASRDLELTRHPAERTPEGGHAQLRQPTCRCVYRRRCGALDPSG